MALNHWSCSKFADWIRGIPKPLAGTTKQWSDWKQLARKKKFRYWLAEEGLDSIQNFFYWPKSRLNDLRYYCHNRWVAKTHALTSHLPRGKWYEFDVRMLHGAFDSLVDFVEIEQAWHLASDKEYRKSFFRLREPRNAEAGLEYLNWAAGLRYDEDCVSENDPKFGHPTHQALGAIEIIALYKWWKESRPKRLDPMDASGWNDYWNSRPKDDGLWLDFENEPEEERKRRNEIHEVLKKMEDEQEEEDTEMLIRLVKLRKGIWT